MKERLTYLRGCLGKTQDEMEIELGLSKNTWIRYESVNQNSIKKIPLELVQNIITTFKINPDWLLFGEGDIFGTSSSASKDNINNNINASNSIAIPLYDGYVSAGPGCDLPDYEYCTPITINRDYLLEHCKTPPKRLFAVTVRGDSMEPTLTEGDLAVVNPDDIDVISGIYVISFNNQVFVKRLLAMPNGVRVISDNNLYQPFEIQPNDDVKVLGKVLLVVHYFTTTKL